MKLNNIRGGESLVIVKWRWSHSKSHAEAPIEIHLHWSSTDQFNSHLIRHTIKVHCFSSEPYLGQHRPSIAKRGPTLESEILAVVSVAMTTSQRGGDDYPGQLDWYPCSHWHLSQSPPDWYLRPWWMTVLNSLAIKFTLSLFNYPWITLMHLMRIFRTFTCPRADNGATANNELKKEFKAAAAAVRRRLNEISPDECIGGGGSFINCNSWVSIVNRSTRMPMAS